MAAQRGQRNKATGSLADPVVQQHCHQQGPRSSRALNLYRHRLYMKPPPSAHFAHNLKLRGTHLAPIALTSGCLCGFPADKFAGKRDCLYKLLSLSDWQVSRARGYVYLFAGVLDNRVHASDLEVRHPHCVLRHLLLPLLSVLQPPPTGLCS